MAIPVTIYIQNTAYQGKLIEKDNGVSLFFSNENGRYFIVANPKGVKISLTGEVGYDLKIEKGGYSSFSLCYGETHTYPSSIVLHSYDYSFDGKRGRIAVSYSLEDDGYEDMEDNGQVFDLSFFCI